MTSDSTTSVLAALAQVRAWQEDFYRNLHQHPELSHREIATAAAVAKRMRESGYEVHEHVGGTGVVAVLRNGEGPAVLLRADMDALPVREQTGLPYASEVTAVDGSGAAVPVMHACGHDVHVTCLLGASALWSGCAHGCAHEDDGPARRTTTGPSNLRKNPFARTKIISLG